MKSPRFTFSINNQFLEIKPLSESDPVEVAGLPSRTEALAAAVAALNQIKIEALTDQLLARVQAMCKTPSLV